MVLGWYLLNSLEILVSKHLIHKHIYIIKEPKVYQRGLGLAQGATFSHRGKPMLESSLGDVPTFIAR